MNILCFGASIVAGFSRGGAIFHPYSTAMLATLEKSIPSLTFTANVQGVPGDWVTSPPGAFEPRMKALYDGNKASYDWAVILGGTNDLGGGLAGEDIYESLKKVWAYPLKHGTKVLALTVTECWTCSSELAERRAVVNDLILKHQEANLYTLDLEAKIPFWEMPEEQRKEIWDDGVHFTEKGYDLMGSIIAQRLIELISETKGINGTQRVSQNPLHYLKLQDPGI